MNNDIDEQVKKEVAQAGGQIEWVTRHGYGLSFTNCTIDDMLLHSIPVALRNVVWLNLSNSRIIESASETLTSASKLEAIDLSGTNVTESMLLTLLSLPKLVKVTAARTAITERERLDFLNRHPQCELLL